MHLSVESAEATHALRLAVPVHRAVTSQLVEKRLVLASICRCFNFRSATYFVNDNVMLPLSTSFRFQFRVDVDLVF